MDIRDASGGDRHTELAQALSASLAKDRLRAAMDAGATPSNANIVVLIAACRTEPDFYVREMLTWALVRHDHDVVFPLVIAELDSPLAQARSQSLHTLSKLADERAWPAITHAHLTDADAGVARTAWRTAAALAPLEARGELAEVLATQFGRGDRDMRRSLSLAFVELGTHGAAATYWASESSLPKVSAHAIATQHLVDNPEDSFDAAQAEAERVLAARTS